jgi:hypothetical protein
MGVPRVSHTGRKCTRKCLWDKGRIFLTVDSGRGGGAFSALGISEGGFSVVGLALTAAGLAVGGVADWGAAVGAGSSVGGLGSVVYLSSGGGIGESLGAVPAGDGDGIFGDVFDIGAADGAFGAAGVCGHALSEAEQFGGGSLFGGGGVGHGYLMGGQ